MSDVIFEVRGRLAHIVLDRPRTINALTHEMLTEIGEALAVWAVDDAITTVLLTGNGPRGLCAGGDVTELHRHVMADHVAGAATFLRDEYLVNDLIARYPKPFVAIMHGYVLGGGIGLAGHASHRIVTESSALGMPEVTIGLTPDVGGTFLLSRAPREAGTYLALTARTASAAEAIELGLADTFVPAEQLPALIASLETLSAAEAVAAAAAVTAAAAVAGSSAARPPATREHDPASTSDAAWISDAFSHDTVSEILDALAASPVEAARDTATLIRTKSPTAVAVTLKALRRARELPTLEACLNQELRVMTNVLALPDFREGVRAQVIDKDRAPRWSPSDTAGVDPASIAACFLDPGVLNDPFPEASSGAPAYYLSTTEMPIE